MIETQHFAWLDTPAPFDAGAHAVFQEPWRSIEIVGAEGNSIVCSVETVNPGRGLLAAGRPIYAHVSLTRDGVTHHLLQGRQVGVPSGISGDFVTLNLDSRFGDIAAAIEAQVAPLRVAPGWDSLYVDPARLTDPMEVLEGYHAHVFIDPRTQAARISDALVGSAVSDTPVTPALGETTIQVPVGLAFAVGVRVRVWSRAHFKEHFSGPITVYAGDSMTVDADAFNGVTARDDWAISLDITADKLAGGSANLTPSTKPYTAVRAVIEAQWTQAASGTVSLTQAIRESVGGPNIRTLSIAEDFAEAWPAAGAAVNGASGYTVQTSTLTKQPSEGFSAPIQTAFGITFSRFPINTYTAELVLSYGMQQKRVEVATLTLEANAQAMLADTSQVELLELHLQDVAPELPDPSVGTFFNTDRGRRALEHGMHLARVAMAESQRAVDITAEIVGWPLEVVYLTTDHTVCVHDPAFPGGFAIGKVAQFSKKMDQAARGCTFTAKASVGAGYTLAGAGQDNDYVEDGYVADGYFVETGAVRNTGGADPLAYQPFGDQQPTDPLATISTWGDARFIAALSVAPLKDAQEDYLLAHAFGAPLVGQDGTFAATPEETLHNNVRTVLTLELASLASTDELRHEIAVEMVGAYGLPATVDLAAA